MQIEQAQAALPDQGGAAATSALQGRRSRKQGACAQGKGLRTVPFSVSGVHGGQSGLAQVCGRARMLQPVDYAAAGVLRIARFVTTELCTVRKQLRKAVADARRYQATAAAQGLKDAKIQVTVLTVVEDNAGAGVEGPVGAAGNTQTGQTRLQSLQKGGAPGHFRPLAAHEQAVVFLGRVWLGGVFAPGKGRRPPHPPGG